MKSNLSQSQKMMIFVLSMSLYGIATLFSELIPKFQLGIIEFSVEYFLFIPLTLAMLFDPLYVGLGAATGELVFSEIMLGQFGGLGELEKFITVTIGIYIAGMLVRNALDNKQVAFASITGVIVQLGLGTLVDVLKVKFAIEEFESIAGLPESVYFTEGFAFINDLLFSGILFCLLPTLYLVPKLYGKIEPLLGIRPRTVNSEIGTSFSLKMGLLIIGSFILATTVEFLAESGFSIISWEAEWAESNPVIMGSFIIATIITFIVIYIFRKKAKNIKMNSGDCYDTNS